MSLRLKCPTCQFPPASKGDKGGFGFTDPRTGRVWTGYEGTPEMHARNIIVHRRGNPHIYDPNEAHWFDPFYVVQEVYQQKFKTSPWLFVGQPDQEPIVTQRAASSPMPEIPSNMGPCSCGATKVNPIYCPTCGGNKVTGYKCAGCGKTR